MKKLIDAGRFWDSFNDELEMGVSDIIAAVSDAIDATPAVQLPRWRDTRKGEYPPDECNCVLALASGRPTENITLEDALVTAIYSGGEWYLDMAPWGDNPVTVRYWMPDTDLPAIPEEVRDAQN